MSIKKLIESMDRIEECGMDEGGMPPMAPQPMPRDDGDPVSMNVSLNARGKDHVADLIDMMKNAGLKDAEPVSKDMMPMRRDMERLRDIVDGPKDMDDLKPGIQAEPCPKCGKMHIGMSSCNDSIENDDEAVAEYDNEPDEQYGAIDDVINSGDDLHRSKKGYAAAAGGDNPMAVEDEEETLEQQILKALQDEYENFKEGDAEDGADMEKCPECGSKKQKLMACSSCGCS
jgi:hypothetical protein